MATATGPGPEREQCVLQPGDIDVFNFTVAMATYNIERMSLSYALSRIETPQAIHVMDGYARKAVKIWRP